MADLSLARVADPEAAAAGRRFLAGRIAIYGILGVFALIYLAPLVVVVLNSFREQPEIARNGLINLPRSFTLEAWSSAWGSYCIGGTCEGMKRNFLNSLAMTIPATIISTLLGALNGYVLSKWRFRGSEALFTLMLLGVFMPGQIALMPWAFVLGKLGLTNSTYGLVLVHVIQGISFTTLFCRNYYVSIPDDLIKAARIDGAGFWRIFRKIVLPLSPPILIVTVIWQFTGIWNEYLFGVVFTSGREQPITAALVALTAGGTTARTYDVMSAAVLIGALPPLLVYFFGGKYFVRGLTQGAIK
ncbi:carbohydrate ABC transporter permease [Prosthecomicrobium pneumaticum]|uniref:Glucose/mannose transport system permease protein n=1 Tax=Prosthecomicrobium pneumaticum TaxID=81895 RepID=A0A7W9FLI2_9HYPH|nr:carbohydrate ABC transporter permease [Prosthecomicrobium pneumaticum]MBB5752878.1 glucose/mannose transport system permease protein [Prosthecomicrobium pneumaticum]